MFSLPVIPKEAPFSEPERLWLNGFLAGLFSRGETHAGGESATQAGTTALPVLILYGTQTGGAEGLAKRFAKQANQSGGAARVVSMEDHSTLDWSTERRVLLVASTYGEGEPPDTALDFWNWLSAENAPRLDSVEYSVLALGDTNYAEFCKFGRQLDERFERLGAIRVAVRAECDADPMETAANWWGGLKDWVFSKTTEDTNGLSSGLVVSSGSFPPAVQMEDTGDAASVYGKQNPFPGTLLSNVSLSRSGSAKDVRHFEISIEGSGLVYQPGDALGVVPTNCPELVEQILEAIRCDGEEAVRLKEPGEVSLRMALQRHLDLGRATKELLALTGASPSEGADLLDALEEGSFRGSPQEFAGVCRKLQPRLYSISSSPKAHPGEVHLTVGVVRYERAGRCRKGVCSTFLAERASPGPVPIFFHESKSFRLPEDSALPIIMVGPGTGIAPFRAFLEERRATGAVGSNWLFFGDQKRACDFLYEEELGAHLKDGHLTRLDLAFSRDEAGKVYVQHRMRESGRELWDWLEKGAHFYVCGDASRMAKDVEAALLEVIQLHGTRAEGAALEYLAAMRKAGRYQRDVY
jgi:sulfite reductase (NADPH) flavoprotein alpha-component